MTQACEGSERRRYALKEDYVSFEIAKLLKDNGFNEITFTWYTGKGKFCKGKNTFNDYHMNEFSDMAGADKNKCSAPTLQMTMKWLREVHGIFISVICGTYPTLNKVTWTPDITTFEKVFPDSAIECNTYEEAVEAAIKYCLENLI